MTVNNSTESKDTKSITLIEDYLSLYNSNDRMVKRELEKINMFEIEEYNNDTSLETLDKNLLFRYKIDKNTKPLRFFGKDLFLRYVLNNLEKDLKKLNPSLDKIMNLILIKNNISERVFNIKFNVRKLNLFNKNKIIYYPYINIHEVNDEIIIIIPIFFFKRFEELDI